MPNNQHQKVQSLVTKFLNELRNNRFAIGVNTYVDALKVTERFLNEDGQNLNELGKYLAPLVCRSSEEQERFNHLFHKSIVIPCTDVVDADIAILESYIGALELKEKKAARSGKVVITVVSTLFILLSAVFIFKYDTFNLFPPIFLIQKQSTAAYLPPGASHELNIGDILKEVGDTSKLEIEWLLNNRKLPVSIFSYSFIPKRMGIDTLAARIYSSKYKIDTFETDDTIYAGPAITMSINTENSFSYINAPVTYHLKKLDSIDLPFEWLIDNNILPGSLNQNTILHTFTDTGIHTVEVRYIVNTDTFLSKFRESYYSTYITQNVTGGQMHISYSEDALPERNMLSVNWWWKAVFILLLLSCIGGFVWVSIKIMNIKAPKKTDDQTDLSPSGLTRLDDFKGRKAPFEIPYKSRDFRIAESTALKIISRHLVKTNETQVAEIDIKKTIQATIRNAELITPVSRKKKSEVYYLFLVDREYSNSQQFKLFSYLVQYFVRRSVKIDYYYYDQLPNTFYGFNGNEKISPLELKDYYRDSGIVVFTSGLSLLDSKKPEVQATYSGLFTSWTSRLLVTPIPYNDWGSDEKILSTVFSIVPADIVGLLEIIRLLQGQPDTKNIFSQDKFASYESRYVNFENYDSLEEYFGNDEDLTQWLCALAVYPKINWHVTIEIGKNILGNNPHKLNYENLLKFARIKWMHAGKFTAFVRLQLLKKLSIENELKARATILKMLDEVAIPDVSFSYEEKMINVYNNSFILFSTSEENKKLYRDIYSNENEIKKNAEIFISLYRKNSNQISDVSLKLYIEKGKKADKAKSADANTWHTPVHVNGENVDIETFIKNKEGDERDAADAELQKARRLWKYLKRAFLIFLGITVFSFVELASNRQLIFENEINSWLHLVDSRDVVFDSSFINIITPCAGILGVAQDSAVSYSIEKNNVNLYKGRISGSDSAIRLPVFSSPDTVTVSFDVSGIAYKATVQTAANKNYYFELKGAACNQAADTVYIQYNDESLEIAATLLKDTLESLGYQVPIVEKRPFDVGNQVQYYLEENLEKAHTLQRITNSFFKTNFKSGFVIEKFALSLPEREKNILKVWIQRVEIVTPPLTNPIPKDTIYLQICKAQDRMMALAFRDKLNKTTHFYCPGVELVDGKCYDEVRYFQEEDASKSKELAKFTGDYFAETIGVVRSRVNMPKNKKNKMEVWINIVPKYKILWVDDHPEENNMEEVLFFRKNGIQVDLARTNKEAYALLNSNTYSLIITDIVRNNPEPCVKDKDKAGVELVTHVTFSARDIFVYSPYLTIDLNRSELLKAGVGLRNLISDKEILKRTIVKAVASGNKVPLYQAFNCDSPRLTTTVPNQPIKVPQPPVTPVVNCDTINSYVGKGKENWFNNGKTYTNIPLSKIGITVSLVSRSDTQATFSFKAEGCNQAETVDIDLGKTETILFCGEQKLIFTFLRWDNATGVKSNKEAIFRAVVCRNLTAPNENEPTKK